MALLLFNSLSRQIEAFAPADPKRVTMYVCGPTVYDLVHIGNARGPVLFGVLAELLRRHYPQVIYARNITDVDDKINAAAAAAQVPIKAITDRYSAAYREDMQRLGVALPDIEPHATAHINEIIAMIERLLANQHAYVAHGHVLFQVSSFPDYGALSRREPDELLAGARVEVAPYKHAPGDFVLWKPSPPELPGWDSPWGRGRPGWHIECSAMAAAHLGETIDIHAGGVDLQFPHHENEVAQSTCAHNGKVLARWWLHNGMLTFDGAKMSKSVGNVHKVRELLAKYPPEALRYALLSAHYRQPLNWSLSLIEQSIQTLTRYYGTLRALADVVVEPSPAATIEQALCDDLNTPAALAELAVLAQTARKARSREERCAAKSKLLGGGAMLGLLQQDSQMWFGRNLTINEGIEVVGVIGGELKSIDELLKEREDVRQAKNFKRADEIREQLLGDGIVIEDTPSGPRWSRRRA